jgi:hypothetical protein
MKKMFFFFLIIAATCFVARGAPDYYFTEDQDNSYLVEVVDLAIIDAEGINLMDAQMINGQLPVEIQQVEGNMVIPQRKMKAEMVSNKELQDVILRPPNITVLFANNLITIDVALIQNERSVLPEWTVGSSFFSNDASNPKYIIASTENTVITVGQKNEAQV